MSTRYRLPSVQPLESSVGRGVLVRARWQYSYAEPPHISLYLGIAEAARAWREGEQWKVQRAPNFFHTSSVATFATEADMLRYLEGVLLLQDDQLPGVAR